MSFSTAVLHFVDPNSQTGTFENGESPGQMPHYAAFHQNLHCLPNQSWEKETQFCWKV